ncbi:hypothetical protein B0H13DRAFT_1879560 [Mycena leptocephala]|nr:hypothetical protein B0H13DRAFT_1879560 [Mycena leptocephala]
MENFFVLLAYLSFQGSCGIRQSFFPNARNFAIYGGTFIQDHRQATHPDSITERSERLTSKGIDLTLTIIAVDDVLALPIIRDETINLIKQLVCHPGYRIHAAELDGRAVAIKVFNGPRAEEDRDASVATSRELSSWAAHHVEGSAEHMLASVLREELRRCLIVGVTMASIMLPFRPSFNDLPARCLESRPDCAILKARVFFSIILTPECVDNLRPAGWDSQNNLKDFDLLIRTNGDLMMSIQPEAILTKEDVITTEEEEDVETNLQLELFDNLCQRLINYSTVTKSAEARNPSHPTLRKRPNQYVPELSPGSPPGKSWVVMEDGNSYGNPLSNIQV